MKKTTAAPTVWVPPGSKPVASAGVNIRTMMAGGQGNAPTPGSVPPPNEGKPAATPKQDSAVRSGKRRRSTKAAGQGRRQAEPGWVYRPQPALPAAAAAPTVGDLESELAYVTPELLDTADQVMGRYDMRVNDMTFITAKPDKGGAIWRIETDRGPRSLKQLHRPAARSLFSVGAQEYLVKRGARVPALIRAKDGNPYVERDGKLWIVTDWVEPLYPASKVDLEGAAALCYGLGEFHRHSKGYVPPTGAQKASRLYRWPKTYAKVLTKIGWFRTIAQAYHEMPASETLLSVVDLYEKQAQTAYDRLMSSPYGTLVTRGESEWGLAHQGERGQSTRDRALRSFV